MKRRTLDIGPWTLDIFGRVIFCSLLALIVAVAVPYGTVDPWWLALYECIVFALGILWIIDGLVSGHWLVQSQKVFIPILLIAAFALLQTISLSSASTASGFKIWNAISADPYETRLSVLELLALAIAGLLLLRYISTPERLRALIYTLIAVGIVSALFGILRQTTQHSEGFFLPLLKPGGGYGQFINRNHFAFLMEMVLGLILGLIVCGGVARDRVLIYLALALPVWVALILCNSRGGILSMLAQILFLALLFSFARAKRERAREATLLWRITHAAIFRPLLIAGLIGTVFVGAIWIGGEALTSRLESISTELTAEGSAGNEGVSRKEIWRATWKMFMDHPLTGVGINGYWAAIPGYHDASGQSTPQQAHNDYLELLASGGIIGAALVAWFLFLFVRRAKRSFQAVDPFCRAASMAACAGLFGVAVHSLVDFGLHVTINALVFTALVVVATGSVDSDRIDRMTGMNRMN
ncbi:MAG: hypothetical protein QOJ64_1924 [Acidobacteriota bacterium]|nr:hypothetical protein [Acidobacteriota bacterium]